MRSALHEPILVLHVLLFGLWLGSDLGTFVTSRFLMQTGRSIETRTTLAKLMLWLDQGPRISLVLILPAGVTLATWSWGWSFFDDGLLALVWLGALAWLGMVLTVHVKEDSPLGARLRQVDLVLRVALGLGLIGVGLVSVAGDGWIVANWLAVKVGLFGVIIMLGVGIRFALRPFGAAFAALAAEGSSPEREAALRRSLVATYPYVFGIWALVLAIGWLGVAKP